MKKQDYIILYLCLGVFLAATTIGAIMDIDPVLLFIIIFVIVAVLFERYFKNKD